MADRVEFELVTPDRLLLEMEVVAGPEGQFRGAPRPRPPISTIWPGMIEDSVEQTVTRRVFVVIRRHRRGDAGAQHGSLITIEEVGAACAFWQAITPGR